MKKLLLVLSFILLAQIAVADFDFYGNARIGVWYVQSDKDFTGGEERFSLEYNLHTNSRFGVNFNSDSFTANIEYGFAEAATIAGAIGVKVWICNKEPEGDPKENSYAPYA